MRDEKALVPGLNVSMWSAIKTERGTEYARKLRILVKNSKYSF